MRYINATYHISLICSLKRTSNLCLSMHTAWVSWQVSVLINYVSPEQYFTTWRPYWVPEDQKLLFCPLQLIPIQINTRHESKVWPTLYLGSWVSQCQFSTYDRLHIVWTATTQKEQRTHLEYSSQKLTEHLGRLSFARTSRPDRPFHKT